MLCCLLKLRYKKTNHLYTIHDTAIQYGLTIGSEAFCREIAFVYLIMLWKRACVFLGLVGISCTGLYLIILSRYNRTRRCITPASAPLLDLLAKKGLSAEYMLHVLVECLISSPHVLQSRNKRGQTVLHLLAQQPATTPQLLEFVLDACPSAVYTCDSFFGALPIHYAAEQKSFPVDSLRVLLRANPSSLLQADGAGFLPLHRALSLCDALRFEVLSELLGHGDAVAAIATTNGNLSLHWCVVRGVPEAHFWEVHRRYPQATTSLNNEAKTPLQLAIEMKHCNSRLICNLLSLRY